MGRRGCPTSHIITEFTMNGEDNTGSNHKNVWFLQQMGYLANNCACVCACVCLVFLGVQFLSGSPQSARRTAAWDSSLYGRETQGRADAEQIGRAHV